MRYCTLIILLLISSGIRAQNSKIYLNKACLFIDTSKNIKSQLINLVTEQDHAILRKSKSLVKVCPFVRFENLSESKMLLLDSAQNWNLNPDELKDWELFKKKNIFPSFIDSFLANRKYKKNNYYSFYASFSKLIGRVLPITIYYNDLVSNENPCFLLDSPQFGQALKVFLIFDPLFIKIQNVVFETIDMN